MADPVSPGSVLGGRYAVNDLVLTSGESDLIFNGVDQVLNRPVSILVPATDNAAQLAASARELATGARRGNMSVLDLGITDGTTYLITSRTEPADLLDLTIPTNASGEPDSAAGDSAADADFIDYGSPSVEPFYTDTLGSEIFGQPRSTEPEDDPDDEQYQRPSYFRRRESQLPIIGGPEDDGSDERQASAPNTADIPTQSNDVVPTPPKPTSAPQKVSDYDGDAAYRPPRTFPAAGVSAAGAGAAAGVAGAGAAVANSAGAQPPAPGGETSTVSAVEPGATLSPESGQVLPEQTDAYQNGPQEYLEEEDAPKGDSDSKGMRWLVGGILAVLLIVSVFLASNQLSTLFASSSDPSATSDQSNSPDGGATSSSPDSTDAQAVAPKFVSVTRLVPERPELEEEGDAKLPLMIDGDPNTNWMGLFYGSATFGNIVSSFGLAFELEQETTVKELTISQTNSEGGSFEVLVNSQASLDGATKVGEGTFNAPEIVVPLKDAEGNPPRAKFVILNITSLPSPTTLKGPYPWGGIRLTEVTAK
ncbi:hypothetical protein [Haematomicrobium sanguinis]|uniref:hypothetical protein n=1 Tax=Haematomicrobium sanguinis TaxID=479106 RepID=UPI00047A402D|nr:hypothetical protein [Haematomicrobium sanguinis]